MAKKMLVAPLCLLILTGIEGRLSDGVQTRNGRQAGYQMCLDTFDIYEDKIIRTQDSRDLGAKYITERDVPSRVDCYQLCCDTDKCDVFVFEEKRPGSCYLFECGPPDDFRCKFTKHRNYTSGVSKHFSELESQIKFTQHESELNNLREPEKVVVNKEPVIAVKTTQPPRQNKETVQLVPQDTNHSDKPVEKCSRFYQFECRSSHECIAIYNACDGIPQCSDGSDEAPELDCPKQGSPVATKEPAKAGVTGSPGGGGHRSKDLSHVSPPSPPRSQPERVPSQQQFSPHASGGDKVAEVESPPSRGVNPVEHSADNTQRQVEGGASRAGYGREGEGMAYRGNTDQWYQGPYRQPQPGPNPQIFAHKGSGMIAQNERYPPQQHYPDGQVNNLGLPGDQPMNEYMRYSYYENPQYRLPAPNQYQQSPWQNLRKPNGGGDEGKYSGGGMMPQEFYYDENSFRGRMQGGTPEGRAPLQETVQQGPVQQAPDQGAASHQAQAAYENRAHLELTSLAKTVKEDEAKAGKVAPPPITPSPTTTTPRTKQEEPRRQISHIKFEKLTADAAFAPSELDGHNGSPNGAVLSLTFGLLMTALMVVLVGCRFRTVRRRLRRGGKGLAHDADFLVNGMYL